MATGKVVEAMATAQDSPKVEGDQVQQQVSSSSSAPARKVEKKPRKGFKIPFFGGRGNSSRQQEPEPDPEPPEGTFRRRTSSVGPNEDVTSISKKKSGNLGKYRKDIDPEPRSTPNF